MNQVDIQYQAVLTDLLQQGIYREGRNGHGTYGLFGHQMKFNLADGFPLLTTKKLNLNSIIHELLWFLKGDTNIKYLNDNGVHIWDEWADKDGNLGPVYGYQWRHWDGDERSGYDQITDVINQIKNNPYSRRHIVTAWNPSDIESMALPPCHLLFQFFVANDKLSCQLYQRSADWFLGVPFNIASYALLTHLVARECGLQVGTFVHTFGDYHLYENHKNQALEQIARLPYDQLPVLVINSDPEVDIFNVKAEDIQIFGYQAWPHIKAEVSV